MVLETDASDFALRWLSSQYQGRLCHTVAFDSQKLNSAEINYPIQANELLQIMGVQGMEEIPHG